MMDKEDEKINNCSPVARHVNEREARIEYQVIPLLVGCLGVVHRRVYLNDLRIYQTSYR